MTQQQGFWTIERQERLKELANDGLSAREIAQRLACTRNAVLGRAWRHGIKLRGPGPGATATPHTSKASHETLARTLNAYKSPPRPDYARDLAFADLDDNGFDCRYVYGEGKNKRFCGQPVAAGRSYCEKCHEITRKKE